MKALSSLPLGHLIEKILSRRFIRFLFVGALNTLFGFLVYSALVFLDLPTWAALLGGNIAGVAFNFLTIGGIVFLDLSPARIPLFVLSYGAIYLVNLELIGLLQDWVHGRIAAQAVLVLPMALLSYFILSRYVFAKARAPQQ